MDSDEKKKYVLTNYCIKDGKSTGKDSDHFTMNLDLNL